MLYNRHVVHFVLAATIATIRLPGAGTAKLQGLNACVPHLRKWQRYGRSIGLAWYDQTDTCSLSRVGLRAYTATRESNSTYIPLCNSVIMPLFISLLQVKCLDQNPCARRGHPLTYA